MTIIKLNAIDSTNDFLKVLSQKNTLENFTVVSAKTQTKGKGQMGEKWFSEPNKNLIISILIKNSTPNIEAIFSLNVTVAVSIIEALEKMKINSLHIKWPNDIMADNKKIAGILIENTIKKNGEIESIVGIGLNVNQTNFENLPKASSLKNVMNQEYNIDHILECVVSKIEENLAFKDSAFFWEKYDHFLFKKGKPTLFENDNQQRFMGIITGVTQNGKLKILLEDDGEKEFGIKEILMIY
jgi:BirA family transcriptional regulator, biotin operon repressor / biotin---[acetyl-CoA-carboxylase] ligase